MKQNDFMKTLKEVMAIVVRINPNLDKVTKHETVKKIMKENDSKLLKFVLTGKTGKVQIKESDLYSAFGNHPFTNVIVSEIKKVIPIKEEPEGGFSKKANELGKKVNRETLRKTKMAFDRINRLKVAYSKAKDKLEKEKIEKQLSRASRELIQVSSDLVKYGPKYVKLRMRLMRSLIHLKMDPKAKKELIAAYKETEKNMIKTIGSKLGDNIKKVGGNVGKYAKHGVMSTLRKIGDKSGATGVARAAASMMSKSPSGDTMRNIGGLGAVALATMLMYGAYKVYKKFFSAAARECRNLSGAEKERCIDNFKKKAKIAQKQDLMRSLVGCKKTSNPKKCEEIIKNKIKKLGV